MAERLYDTDRSNSPSSNGLTVRWPVAGATKLANEDTGQAIRILGRHIVTVQPTGTFGATPKNVIMEGSVVAEDGPFALLKDIDGNTAQIASAGIISVRDSVEWIRPRIEAGTSAQIEVFMRVQSP